MRQYKLFRVTVRKRLHYSVYDFTEKCKEYIEKDVLTTDDFKNFLKKMCKMKSKQMSIYMLNIIEEHDNLLEVLKGNEDKYNRVPFTEIEGDIKTFYSNN